MKYCFTLKPVGFLLVLFSVCLTASPTKGAVPEVATVIKPENALKTYLAKPDNSFKWVKKGSGKIGTTEYTELILTSQTWKDIVWKHQLFIIKPASVKKETKHAMLVIVGGSWENELETEKTEIPLKTGLILAGLAEKLKTPIAVLLQVPQQPLFDGKYEDGIIAYTFEKYLRTGDTEWPLLLPMTKSAVRGMDTIQKFSKKEWGLNLKTFTVTGASKRGWTTWLTAATDKRVKALAPIVIDMLNMEQHMKHSTKVWGKPSAMIHDYTDRGLLKQLATKRGRKLQQIVDPFSYRKIIQQPKLLIIGTNDRYWPLDSLKFYWKELKGPKYILYVPNNRHGLRDYTRVLGTLNALHQSAHTDFKMPKLTWKAEKKQTKQNGLQLLFDVQSDIKPKRVNLWQATSKTHDFREAQWTSTTIKPNEKKYHKIIDSPKTGYVALFGEAVYQLGENEYYLSTNVSILPAAQEKQKK